jgi:hypothetical protein
MDKAGIADGLRSHECFKHLVAIADKTIAHANLSALQRLSVGHAGIPKLPPDALQPRLLLTMVKEVSDAFVRHVRPIDFEVVYLDSSRMSDRFRSSVQRTGVPWVDFHLREIFLDPSNLTPSLRNRIR